jgi:hypothetical protein
VIREATQLLAAFLADSTYGINAMAADLPRTILGSSTTAPAPPTVNIYNDVDDAGVAKNLTPPEFPSMIVFGETREVSDSNDDKAITPHPIVVAVGFVTNDSADEQTSQAACSLLLRAGRRSLRRYRQQRASANYRDLNGIRVMDVTAVRERRVTAVAETVKLWGWLEVHLTVVDGIA